LLLQYNRAQASDPETPWVKQFNAAGYPLIIDKLCCVLPHVLESTALADIMSTNSEHWNERWTECLTRLHQVKRVLKPRTSEEWGNVKAGFKTKLNQLKVDELRSRLSEMPEEHVPKDLDMEATKKADLVASLATAMTVKEKAAEELAISQFHEELAKAAELEEVNDGNEGDQEDCDENDGAKGMILISDAVCDASKSSDMHSGSSWPCVHVPRRLPCPRVLWWSLPIR
jgi:hypothetical protein